MNALNGGGSGQKRFLKMFPTFTQTRNVAVWSPTLTLFPGWGLLCVTSVTHVDYRYEMFQKESTSATSSGSGGLVLICKPGPDLFF